MSIWELPKEPQFYNWESPITKIYGDIHSEIVRQDEENCTLVIEQALGYKVDKYKLIKALQYDREQYDKGYKDGRKEIFVEELKKIRAEIEQDAFKDVNGSKYIFVNRVNQIIDKYKVELKGENNEI